MRNTPSRSIHGALDQRVKIGGNRVHRFLEFGKGPAAKRPEIVDPGHPIGVHRIGLALRVLATIALDPDYEVQQIGVAMPVLDPYGEVGQVFFGVAPSRYGTSKPSS